MSKKIFFMLKTLTSDLLKSKKKVCKESKIEPKSCHLKGKNKSAYLNNFYDLICEKIL